MNANGVPGSVPIAVTLPDGTTAFAVIQDFDDLHEFNVSFDSIALNDLPNSGAIDVANVVWLGDETKGKPDETNLVPWRAAEALRARDWQFTGLSRGAAAPTDLYSAGDVDAAPEMSPTDDPVHENGIGIVYGIRAIQRSSSFNILLRGSVLHGVSVETEADNEILGPQVGAILARRIGRISVRLQATVLAGFNFGDVNQQGLMGQGIVPGALNQPLYARSTQFRHQDQFNEFSPAGELRAEARYHLLENATFSVVWSGLAIENALFADSRVNYETPDFGLIDPGEQSIVVHNLFVGIEFVL